MRQLYWRDLLTSSDLYYSPVYLLIILLGAMFVRNILYHSDNPLRQYFIPGLLVKIVGAISVGLIYHFYYGGGDTNSYFSNAMVFNTAFNDNPIHFWKLLINPVKNDEPFIQEYLPWMYFHRDPAAYAIGKIAGILNLATFNIYTPCAMLFAVLSFTGAWAMYVTFCDIYPSMHKQFALGVLFVPSVFFWGSGILKDCVTFGCVGWLTYCSYQIFFKGKNFVFNSFILIVSAYLTSLIKAYILFAFIPSLLFWIFFHYREKVVSPFVKTILGPIVFVATLVLGYMVIGQLGSQFQRYSIDNAVGTAKVYQDNQTQGSGYTLGSMDGSFLSVLKNIPAAANVTLFRPYLWEVRNPVMLLSALESTIILFFTLKIFFKTGFKMTIKSLLNNPTAFFCIFFAVFFGFCVGFTAYNFGALVRYKIPCIPFYVVGLYILQYQTIIDLKKRVEAVPVTGKRIIV